MWMCAMALAMASQSKSSKLQAAQGLYAGDGDRFGLV